MPTTAFRSSNFRQALELACLDQSLFWRDQAHQMAADALAAVKAILTDPKSPAAVRLLAALAILEKASAPLPRVPADLQPQEAPPENTQPMHNYAQPPNEINELSPSEMPPPGPNDPCICGSGRKFKNCCIGRCKSELFLIRLHNLRRPETSQSVENPAEPIPPPCRPRPPQPPHAPPPPRAHRRHRHPRDPATAPRNPPIAPYPPPRSCPTGKWWHKTEFRITISLVCYISTPATPVS